MKTYRWGILAPGKIAHKFSQGLQLTSNGKVYAIGSRDAGRANDFAKQYGAEKSYGTYEGLINDPDVDVIYIASPHTFHYQHTKECLAAGKPVLCEKPFTINSKQFRHLMKIAGEKELFMMDALWTRFHPHILKLHELIKEGRLGKIRTLEADFGFYSDFDPESRLFNPDLGGGSLLDIGIYPVFLSLLILGYPKEISAQAYLGKTNIDESLSVSLLYESGAVASLLCSFKAWTGTTARISGEEGRIFIPESWFNPNNFYLIDRNKESTTFEFPENDNGYQYEAIEVMKCLDNNKKQSDLLPHQFTLQLIELMDEIRVKAGIKYKEDQQQLI